jgi:hypothetical protein
MDSKFLVVNSVEDFKKAIFDSSKLKSITMKNWISAALLVFVSMTVFAQETMTIQVDITNRKGDVVYLREGRKNIQEIKADDKGVFKSTFAIKEGMYTFFDGNEYAQLFLKPGYDLKMTLDATKFDETLQFSGTGAKENNFLDAQTLIDQKIDFDSLLAMDETNLQSSVFLFFVLIRSNLNLLKFAMSTKLIPICLANLLYASLISLGSNTV